MSKLEVLEAGGRKRILDEAKGDILASSNIEPILIVKGAKIIKDRKLYLKQIPITPEVYEQLQELWSYNLLDCNHTPVQAIQAARQLNLLS